MSQHDGDHGRRDRSEGDDWGRWSTYWPAQRPSRSRRALGAFLCSLAWWTVVLAALVAVPVTMALAIGWPLPTWEEITEISDPSRTALVEGPRWLLRLVACVVWPLWALVVLVLLRAAVSSIRHARPPRLRLPSPLRHPVTAMFGGLVLVSTVARSGVPEPSPAVAPVEVGQPMGTGETAPVSAPVLPVGQVTVMVVDRSYTHTVVRGDTLSEIAQAWLGDANRWPEIYALNQGHAWPEVGGRLSDPDLIYPGWTLRLPSDATPPAQSEPTETEPAPADSPSPETSSPAEPTSEASTAPAASASEAAASAASGQSREEGQGGGVRLPSQSWISFGLAASIASAAALARMRRRRRARLRFPIPTCVEPSSDPLSGSVSSVGGGTGSPKRAEEAVSVGVDAEGRECDLFDLATGVVGVRGEGAEAVVRAVLAAVLTATCRDRTGGGRLVGIGADLLARLSPREVAPVVACGDPGVQGLRVPPDSAGVVDWLEDEAVRCRRLLDEAPSSPPPGWVVVVEADEERVGRLRAAVSQFPDRGALAIVLGAGEAIPSYAVGLDGTVVSSPAGGARSSQAVSRFSTLGEGDLASVLDVLSGTSVDSGDDPDADDSAVRVSERVADAVPVATEEAVGGSRPVRLSVLGPVALSTVVSGRLTSGLRSGSASVLALLAVYPEGRGLDELATTTRPRAGMVAARSSTRTDITTVRALLRRATGLGGAMFVVFEGDRYRLDRDLFDVDLWEMSAAIERANRAGDDEECLAALCSAAGSYGGDLATNLDHSWVADHATTIRNQVLSVYGRISEILEADHPDRAIAALERAIGYDPINEELYQRLMRVHGRLGRIDDVRRTLRLLGDRLAELDEPGVSPATERIAARLLGAEPQPGIPHRDRVGGRLVRPNRVSL